MRKFIQILNELSISDFGHGGGPHGAHVLAYDIVWDADDPEDIEHLPNEVVLTVEGETEEEMEDAIADVLSDRFGFCVNSFNFRFI